MIAKRDFILNDSCFCEKYSAIILYPVYDIL